MNKYLLLILGFILLLFVSACQEEGQQPIEEGQKFAATLNVGDFTIDFLNESKEKFARWELKKAYTGGFLLPDGDTLLLYGTELEEVDLYSLKAGSIKQSIKTGKGITNGIYIKGSSEFAFADKAQNKIRFFNKEGQEVGSAETADYPMAMIADEKRVYAASFKGKKLSMINVFNHIIEDEMTIPGSAAGILLREGEEELWIGGHGSGGTPQSAISVYSLETKNLKEEISAPLMPVDFFENDQGIYALSHGTNMLYRFNSDKQLVRKAEVGANPFAISALGGKLLVAGFDSEKLYWIDPETLEIEHEVSVGKGPFIIFTREKVE